MGSDCGNSTKRVNGRRLTNSSNTQIMQSLLNQFKCIFAYLIAHMMVLLDISHHDVSGW